MAEDVSYQRPKVPIKRFEEHFKPQTKPYKNYNKHGMPFNQVTGNSVNVPNSVSPKNPAANLKSKNFNFMPDCLFKEPMKYKAYNEEFKN